MRHNGVPGLKRGGSGIEAVTLTIPLARGRAYAREGRHGLNRPLLEDHQPVCTAINPVPSNNPPPPPCVRKCLKTRGGGYCFFEHFHLNYVVKTQQTPPLLEKLQKQGGGLLLGGGFVARNSIDAFYAVNQTANVCIYQINI